MSYDFEVSAGQIALIPFRDRDWGNYSLVVKVSQNEETCPILSRFMGVADVGSRKFEKCEQSRMKQREEQFE